MKRRRASITTVSKTTNLLADGRVDHWRLICIG
jgi:hypothetical protein